MSTETPSGKRTATARIHTIALGSDRAAKIMAVRASIARIAEIDSGWRVREILVGQKLDADLYVGLEGGFHSISIDGEWHTFLRGWAFVTDGERDSFGMSPSISVPEAIVKSVIGGKRELGIVIDALAGARDVRSRQGAWGVLSRDLLTRAMSFEAALIAAFAPFYNWQLYLSKP